ncbi:hypothetical protein, partial [Vibrio splendidus]
KGTFMDDIFKSLSTSQVEDNRDELLSKIRCELNKQADQLCNRYIAMNRNELIAKMRFENMPGYENMDSFFDYADGQQLVKHFIFTRVVLLNNVAFEIVKDFSNSISYGFVEYEDTALKEDIDNLQEQTIKYITDKICMVHDFDDSRKYLYQRAYDVET